VPLAPEVLAEPDPDLGSLLEVIDRMQAAHPDHLLVDIDREPGRVRVTLLEPAPIASLDLFEGERQRGVVGGERAYLDRLHQLVEALAVP
jgi:hypothetical protein